MDAKTNSQTEKKTPGQTNAAEEVGFVKSVRDFLVYIDGLPSIKVNDLIVSENGVGAVVTSLFAKEVEAWVLTAGKVKPGELFKVAKNRLSILVGPYLLGRAINPVGVTIDDLADAPKEAAGLALKSELMELDREALGISARQFISEQFVTGLSSVDLLVPLGKGQRELLVGDTRSGKTGFLLDLIVNQNNSDTIVVYGIIGKSMGAVKNTMRVLSERNALKNVVIVAGFSTDPLPLIYLTPKAAMAVAEYFRGQGKNVLLILDDMGSHSKVFREISLLANKFPGREAYPGDIFHQHAALLERAGKFDEKAGGGSITAIPVIELDLNDFSSYIPTNLMSMTDGHLLFKSNIYAQGRRPAIDFATSVSRVGRQTQNTAQNSLSTKVKQTLASAEQLTSVAGFGGELPLATQLLLRQKDAIIEFLSQESMEFIGASEQVVLLALPYIKFFSDKDVAFILSNKEKIINALKTDTDLTALVKTVPQIKNIADLITSLDRMSEKFAKLTGQEISVDNIVDADTWLPKF